jgi:hypothetical protein
MDSVAQHILCVRCHKDVEPEWAFCPKCGGDNRPPERRTKVECKHHDYARGQHCVICGHKRPAVDETGAVVNPTWHLLKVGIRCLVAMLVGLYCLYNAFSGLVLGFTLGLNSEPHHLGASNLLVHADAARNYGLAWLVLGLALTVGAVWNFLVSR